MNSISFAMQNAGMRLPPLNKRVWLWAKDHPSKSAQEIAMALGEKHANVSSTLCDMMERNMMDRTDDTKRLRNNATIHIWRYTAKGATYELLPKPVKPKASKLKPEAKATIKSVPMKLSPYPVAVPEAALVSANPLARLEDCTLRELREVHAALTKLLKGV